MKCRLFFPIAMSLWLVVHQAAAQSPFFWDDFDRESVFEGTDIAWLTHDDADYSIEDGSVIFEPLADTFPGLLAQTEFYADVRLRTQIRFLDVDTCANNPFIGMLVRDPLDGQSNNYWAGPSTDGRIHIGETVFGGIQVRSRKSEYTCDELKENDLHMQLDAVGDTISFTSWLDEAEKPSVAQLVMEDDTNILGDLSGLFINASSSLSGFAIRYFATLPALPGDYDASGNLEVNDLDLLQESTHADVINRVYDVNEDEVVDDSDVSNWLAAAAIHRGFGSTFLEGDANLDGLVDAEDLNALGLNWNQATTAWSGGDFNADGFVDAADLNMVGLNWQKVLPQASSLSESVPEPSTLSPLLVALAAITRRRLRHSDSKQR